MSRRFLFLQGVCSPFFRCLGAGLREHGHEVCKINFNGGDALAWRGGGATSYRGRIEDLPAFYAHYVQQHAISDVVLFGDQRPVHRAMTAQARALGVRVHVYEEGYFRPHWITLERDGVNAHSGLPRDPRWYLETARRLPHVPHGNPLSQPFRVRAWHDVLYHLGSAVNPLLYPHYRTHAVHAVTEYWHYIKRGLQLPGHARRDREQVARLFASRTPYFLLPLQLGSDAQIRQHSRFESMLQVLDHVLVSFAQAAPGRYTLVIKNHPLDPGLNDYAAHVREACRLYGLQGRVLYLETGNTPDLLKHARGVVTVNSTVGASALLHRRATKTLGAAIYDMPGLTFQGPLDAFWHNPGRPNNKLFRAFRDVVIHGTQVDGGFYTRAGIERAVRNSIKPLTDTLSPLQALKR
ncbi:capsular biosynthesis protein [Orrella sp. JC864]|uniref:capsule biosynthesis protein n=1 Tax=Orrella sp. JC864 TaxID=3120298 RepID=UPI0012BC9997